MELIVRPMTEAEAETFRAKMALGFGGDAHEADRERFRQNIPPDRTSCAFDGDEMVGTCAGFGFDLTVPGGTLPMCGTTMVTVQPTHRRRGVLRGMMQGHLDDTRRRGDPLAGLWASESSIYGRFGYGLAAYGYELNVDGNTIEFTGDPPPGRVKFIEADEAPPIFAPIHERIRRSRPGMLSRTEAWWTTRVLHDPEHWRNGHSKKRYAVYHGPDGPDGYVIYRQKEKWDDFPEGSVRIEELMAATPEAHAGLWQFVTRIDLFPKVRYGNAPIDDELPWRVTEGRRVKRLLWDTLWLRLLDISASLAGRVYECEERLVIGVRDPFYPDNDGCYELETVSGGPDAPSCDVVDATPDIELDVGTLGALYLGGQRVGELARAGLITGAPEALATADRLFHWRVAPWCPEDF